MAVNDQTLVVKCYCLSAPLYNILEKLALHPRLQEAPYAYTLKELPKPPLNKGEYLFDAGQN